MHPRQPPHQLKLTTPELPDLTISEIKEEVLGLRDQISALRETRDAVERRRAEALERVRGAEAALRAAHEARVAERQQLLTRSAFKVGGCMWGQRVGGARGRSGWLGAIVAGRGWHVMA